MANITITAYPALFLGTFVVLDIPAGSGVANPAPIVAPTTAIDVTSTKAAVIAMFDAVRAAKPRQSFVVLARCHGRKPVGWCKQPHFGRSFNAATIPA